MKSVTTFVLAAGILLGASFIASAQGIKGNFTAVGPIPPQKSAQTVVVEEFLNFTCPHCNNFRDVSKPVFDKHGKRLKLVRIPLLFRGQNDPPLRLFYVAQAQGKEDLIADALFDAAFKYNVNIYDPSVINFIARTNGLAEAMAKDANSDWVNKKMADGVAKANAMGVESTPTLVLQGSIKMTPDTRMEAFIADFGSVVEQLLK